jgi:6-phosphogluconolactonase
MINPDIRIAEAGHDWAQAAASLLHTTSDTIIDGNGRCVLALSGGSTPNALYEHLAIPDWKSRLRWRQIRFVFGDERCVPPDHPESNFAMAQRALFLPLDIQPAHIYRMKGEADDPMVAAQDYEQTLRQVTNCPSPVALPRIDLILLGLGEDGHTASLFPESPALDNVTAAVAVSHSPKGIPRRLTLTLGVINHATVVVFLVSGVSKAPTVRSILEPQSTAERVLPAARVAPHSGQLIWMLDHHAASQLSRRP